MQAPVPIFTVFSVLSVVMYMVATDLNHEENISTEHFGNGTTELTHKIQENRQIKIAIAPSDGKLFHLRFEDVPSVSTMQKSPQSLNPKAYNGMSNIEASGNSDIEISTYEDDEATCLRKLSAYVETERILRAEISRLLANEVQMKNMITKLKTMFAGIPFIEEKNKDNALGQYNRRKSTRRSGRKPKVIK